MENKDSAPFFEWPNDQKPENYPQKFVYPSKETMPKRPPNRERMPNK